MAATVEHLTPQDGMPFGFDPESYTPITPGGTIFLSPEGDHVIRVQNFADMRAAQEASMLPDNPLLEESLTNARIFATITDFHFELLQLFGMHFPERLTDDKGAHKPETQAAIGLFPSQTTGQSSLTIFRKVPFIEGTPLEKVERPPVQLVIDRIVSPSFKYFTWLNTTEQPYFMGDVIAPPAVTVGYSGEQHTLLAEESDIVLHDLGVTPHPRNSLFSSLLLEDIDGVAIILGDAEEDGLADEEFERLSGEYLDLRSATTASLGLDT